jgi:protein TonB
MGNLTVPEYERMDEETLPFEMQAGGFKHNGSTVLESGISPHGRQIRQQEAIEPDATMANNLLDQIEESQAAAATTDGVELDLAFGVPVEETPLWIDLYESIRDIFFPPKLPPLELTSTPIPVPDRMAVKRNWWAVGSALIIEVAILLLVLLVMGKKILDAVNKPRVIVTTIDISEFKAPKANIDAGGGGGSPDKMEAIKGRIPPRAKAPDVTAKVETPPDPTIDVQNNIIIPDNARLPNFGQSNSPNVKLGSLGNGSGMGLGSGNGNGYGPGSGGNIGGGLERVGGRISAPIPINNVEAEFSDEARRAKYQGEVTISLIVDAQGYPQDPRVVRALGMGLDEKALEAVRKYRFKPAMRDGRTPVAVMVNVVVNFHLY